MKKVLHRYYKIFWLAVKGGSDINSAKEYNPENYKVTVSSNNPSTVNFGIFITIYVGIKRY